MRSAGIAGLLSFLASLPIVAQQEARELVPSKSYTRPAELLAVEGQRHLNLFCIGTGTPAIIFISGAWENTMPWRRAQGPSSQLSRACSYDRAGLGFSDPATRPSTALNTVDDLRRLLDAAKIQMPVVLVGHSAGGLYAMIFAALYPERVAGLVLVDPRDPEAENNLALAGHLPPEIAEESRRQIETSHQQLGHCVDLARKGLLTPDTKDPYCLMSEADSTLKTELDRQHIRPQTKEAILSEMVSLGAPVEGNHSLDDIQFRQAITSRNFLALPLILLRRGNRQKHPLLPQEIFDKNEVVYLAGYNRIAGYSSRGTVRTISESGHHIQLDQPQAVVTAIEEVLSAVRSGR